MKGIPKNRTGIVLRTVQAGEGGRSVHFFTCEEGQLTVFAARGTVQKYGAGGLLPFALVRFTCADAGAGCIMSQYESRLPFDMLALTYEEMQQWYFAAELVLHFFPQKQPDHGAYQVMEKAIRTAGVRNKTVTAFILAVQLLMAAGYDPSQKEPSEALGLRPEAAKLLNAFCRYSWTGPLGMPVKSGDFQETARYLRQFLERYCDVRLHTADAFIVDHT